MIVKRAILLTSVFLFTGIAVYGPSAQPTHQRAHSAIGNSLKFTSDPQRVARRERIRGISLSPDGKHLLVIDDGFWLMALENGNHVSFGLINRLGHKKRTTTCAAISPDGKEIVSGADDGEIRIWDIATGQETKSLRLHNEKVNMLIWSADGTKVLSGCNDNRLLLWMVNTGKVVTEMNSGRIVSTIAMSPDGNWALSGTGSPYQLAEKDGNYIQVWNLISGQMVHKLYGHSPYVFALGFSPNGRLALSAGVDGTVITWNIPNWKQFKKMAWPQKMLKGDEAKVSEPKFAVFCCTFTPDNRYVLGAGSGGLVMWEVASGGVALEFPRAPSYIMHVAVLPSGKQAVTVTLDNTIAIWDLVTAREVKRY